MIFILFYVIFVHKTIIHTLNLQIYLFLAEETVQKVCLSRTKLTLNHKHVIQKPVQHT